MSNNDAVLQVKDLKMGFKTDYGFLPILNGIDFSINAGETLGIVGESGCGKSVTSLCIMRLLAAVNGVIDGQVIFQGKNLLELSEKEMRHIRGNRISMIFQEPMTSLNPVFTIGNQLSETLRLHQGLSKREARNQSIEMLKMVRMSLPEQRIKEYPYQLSGGMRQRVMIAMALACKPALLIADEPTTALDVTIQAQVLELMKDLQKEFGTSIMFITHDLGVIREMCDQVAVMYCGEVLEEAPVKLIFSAPKHPYTTGLLETLPKYGQPGELPTIPGMVPPAGSYQKGCVFAPRCRYAQERCMTEKPSMCTCADGSKVRCFRYSENTEV